MRSPGRLLLSLAAALYLLATVIWVGAERRSPRQFLSAGSALNDGERGTSLAREYLRERPGHPAARLLERPVSAGELPAGAVVFRLEPEVLPWRPWRRAAPEPEPKPEKDRDKGKKSKVRESKGKKSQAEEGEDDDADDEEKASAVHPGRFVPLLTADEEEWVEGGGRLVLGIIGSYGPVWADRESDRQPDRQPLAKVFPLWPEVRNLRLLDRRVLRGPALGRAHAVLLAGEAPVLARLPLGRGDVVLLSCPDVFHNARLAVGDHLALLAALASSEGPEIHGEIHSRPVYFDERTHGIQADAGLLDVLARWGLGPALLLAGLAALAVAAREKVRVGPAERDPPDRRSEAVDLVDSLGELYDRSLTRGDAIRLYWEGFVHAVGVDTGLAGASLTARAEELAAGFLPPASGENLSREGFERALRALNSARRRARDGKYDRRLWDG